MSLASTLVSVESIADVALEFAQAAGFPTETASHLSTVCAEAAANAVIHGNRFDPAKRVTAIFEATRTKLTVTVCDEGEGFDPESLPDPVAPANLMRTSGRGVFLMRSFMDEVHYRNLHPGTEVSLVKHRNQPA